MIGILIFLLLAIACYLLRPKMPEAIFAAILLSAALLLGVLFL